MSETDENTSTPRRTPHNRMIQGALLALGALLLAITVGADRIDFYWTPLIIGLTYLVAAMVDGPRGGYWATALGLVGWGLAVAVIGYQRPHQIDPAGAYLVGVGLAAGAAAILRNRGFLISEVGFGITVAAGGALLALTPRVDAFEDATNFAFAIGAVGILNLAYGLFEISRSRGGPSPRDERASRSGVSSGSARGDRL